MEYVEAPYPPRNHVGHAARLRRAREIGGGGQEHRLPIPRPDHSSEIWLPITEPQEYFEPHFAVHISLAQPRRFASDWPTWVERWELDGLVDYFYRVVRWEVVPMFNEFIQHRD